MRHHLSKKITFLILFSFLIFSIFTTETIASGAGSSGSHIAKPVGGGGGGEINYKPIAPGYDKFKNQFLKSESTGNGFESILSALFKASIYFTVILSVIMIIIGGVEYMGSESVFKKGEGKERIFAALSGLLIALVSILLISTILPGGNGQSFRIDIFGEQ